MNKKKRWITGIIVASTIGFLGITGFCLRRSIEEWYWIQKAHKCESDILEDVYECAETKVIGNLVRLKSIYAFKFNIRSLVDILTDSHAWTAYEKSGEVHLSVKFQKETHAYSLRSYFDILKRIQEGKPEETNLILENMLQSQNQEERTIASCMLFKSKQKALQFIPEQKWQDLKSFDTGFRH